MSPRDSFALEPARPGDRPAGSAKDKRRQPWIYVAEGDNHISRPSYGFGAGEARRPACWKCQRQTTVNHGFMSLKATIIYRDRRITVLPELPKLVTRVRLPSVASKRPAIRRVFFFIPFNLDVSKPAPGAPGHSSDLNWNENRNWLQGSKAVSQVPWLTGGTNDESVRRDKSIPDGYARNAL